VRSGEATRDVRDIHDATRLYEAAMRSLGRAVFRELDAKRALLVAIAGRFALAITGWTGGGKTFLVEQGLRLISDLDKGDVTWIPTFGMFPGWLLDGRERVVPEKDKTITQRELSMLEQRPNAKVLVFDMLDVIDGESSGKELWRFANRLQGPWSQRLDPVEPHLTQVRLLLSTWIPPYERHTTEAPTNMRRLHHLAVSLGTRLEGDLSEAAVSIWHAPEGPPDPVTPVGYWSDFDGVDRVARDGVRFDDDTWRHAGLAADRERLGTIRSGVAEHAARILAAYEGRDTVLASDLTETVRWSRMASEC
jgi:hypothetical protein